MNLSERQKNVLQCVIDAKNEGKRPFTRGVHNRMIAKGYEITERQCAYDLGVIINTKGTGVISMKLGNRPTCWIYSKPSEEATANV
ncbi:hypothetical protein [Acinetobacter colistiniresistens]|uniref:hypothetical protein n=1 Tax=Acinetobacter colistiniresistens TaxID=280145 RepID=UPI00148F104A|nr:hypothetical protein [Acinetobacter colistiniresistens]